MNEFRAKLLTIGYLSRGQSKPRVFEGRSHPETNVRYKITTDESGSVTEHANDRVDAVARVETIYG